jgi:hypothetical protein
MLLLIMPDSNIHRIIETRCSTLHALGNIGPDEPNSVYFVGIAAGYPGNGVLAKRLKGWVG